MCIKQGNGARTVIFQSEDFYVSLVEKNDVGCLVEVYNSNTLFLKSHLGTDHVTSKWLTEEQETMRNAGFCSCKAVEKKSRQIIGIVDFKIDEEAYLSLLMIHKDFENKGFGKQIFQAFEEYVKSKKSNSIRLDVVTGYNDKVVDFWIRNGFEKIAEIQLNWTGVILPAVTMKKEMMVL